MEEKATVKEVKKAPKKIEPFDFSTVDKYKSGQDFPEGYGIVPPPPPKNRKAGVLIHPTSFPGNNFMNNIHIRMLHAILVVLIGKILRKKLLYIFIKRIEDI